MIQSIERKCGTSYNCNEIIRNKGGKSIWKLLLRSCFTLFRDYMYYKELFLLLAIQFTVSRHPNVPYATTLPPPPQHVRPNWRSDWQCKTMENERSTKYLKASSIHFVVSLHELCVCVFFFYYFQCKILWVFMLYSERHGNVRASIRVKYIFICNFFL